MRSVRIKQATFLTVLTLGLLVLTISFGMVSAQSNDNIVHETPPVLFAFNATTDCVIPDSGPWPPCATGGTSPGNGEECVIPDSGPWPPCATGGNTNPGDSGSSGDCVIPDSGPWPPCATGGNTSPGDAGGSDECVIPESGPWPPCATNGQSGPPATGMPSEDLAVRIGVAIEDLHDHWTIELREEGIVYRKPRAVEFYTSGPNDQPNAFYVPALDSIFIDLRLLDEITAAQGDYAAIAILAHEWAHFIQDQAGILFEPVPLRQIELQADCFAGTFTKFEEGRNRLAAGDVQVGQSTFYSVGDDIIAPDLPYDFPGAHGTGQERQTAYIFGYNNGAQGCMTQYVNR